MVVHGIRIECMKIPLHAQLLKNYKGSVQHFHALNIGLEAVRGKRCTWQHNNDSRSGGRRNHAVCYPVANSFPINRSFQTQKKANAIPRNPVIAVAQHLLTGFTGGQCSHQDQVYTYGAVHFHPNPLPLQANRAGSRKTASPSAPVAICATYFLGNGVFFRVGDYVTLKHTKRKTEVGLYIGNFLAQCLWFFST